MDVTAIATVLVMEAEDEDSALQYARDELIGGNYEIDQMTIGDVIDPSDEKAVERAKRNADVVAENL